MDTLVVGAGQMGRWVGDVLHREFPRSVDLTYYDEASAKSKAASEEIGGEFRRLSDDDSFDAVCFAVPIPATRDAISAHARRAEEVVFDVTGTMIEPVQAMAEHAPDCERMSLHPLFAPGNEPGNIPVVLDHQGPRTELIQDLLKARGNTVFETTAGEHDEMMETVQAKTHAAVLAFAIAADTVPPEFHTPISEPLQNLAEQVTGGHSRVYSDIQAAFDGAEDVANAARQLSNADREAFEQLYESVSIEPDDQSGQR